MELYTRTLQLERNQAAKVQPLFYHSSVLTREATREFDFSTSASKGKKRGPQHTKQYRIVERTLCIPILLRRQRAGRLIILFDSIHVLYKI